MTWNHNLSTAPQDAPIWLASVCGKVIKSQWAKTKTGGYWPGFKSDGSTPPIAWQPFVVPTHPGAVVQPMGVSTGEIEFLAACDGEGSV